MHFLRSFNPNLHAVAIDPHDLHFDLPVDVDRLTDLSTKYQHNPILHEPEVIEERIFVPYPEAGLYSCYGTQNVSYVKQVM
ncbi:hypothetical protein Pr1d_34180 [Bythopirellula goksoeyrii]|uniref:Uncharacterized protein n=1 Tax=Bythopirellula goksoeyrii TaxID=1400387 RepID=A0A5B9QE48_9BACT|nr:hypothetical protein Pr1d_34180 [Bythopirellula goksoeyrii]